MANFKFRFYWSDEEGNLKGMWGKKGSIRDDVLVLHKTEIPIPAIVETENRGKFLVIRVMGADDRLYDMYIRSSKADKIKGELGRIRSAAWAENYRQELQEKGEEDVFRIETCPACQATLNLSHFPVTPQIHCSFCNAIGTFEEDEFDEHTVVQADKDFGICDECQMFAKPRRFTILYFYFLFVIYGFYTQPTWRCPPCMRKDAWKMLFGNLIFVLGVPVAVVQLFRSYGGTSIGGKYAGLDRANLRARKGHLESAVEAYRQILHKHPTAAGVKYNIGLAFLGHERIEEATQMFEYALKDCSNYLPAAECLVYCYEQLGESEKLDELNRIWTSEDEDVDESMEADGFDEEPQTI